MRRGALRSIVVVSLLTASVWFVPNVAAFTPPPPEFPDVVEGSGVDFYGHRWTPGLGDATSVLDILPLGSPAAADANGDGYPELFFPSTRYTDDALDAARLPTSKLYLNDGSTTTEPRFRDITDIAGVGLHAYAYSASWADYDNDGDNDLFVGGYEVARLYQNGGDATFTDITGLAALPQDLFILGGAWGDYDNDGDLDLFLVGFADYDHPTDGVMALDQLTGTSNRLLRNDGGTFVDVSATAGLDSIARRSTSASFVDFDVDGDLDVYVTNYGEAAEAWRNDGGAFTEVAASLGIADGAAATCQAWEDMDRDGHLDLVVAHEDGVMAGVWLGSSGGTFTQAAPPGLGASSAGDAWGCVVFDYDGDADMDLFFAHGGMPEPTKQRPTLLANQLDLGFFAFSDETAEAGDGDLVDYAALDDMNTPMALSGAMGVDWNLDGAPDVVAVGNDGDGARMIANLGWVVWTGNGDWFNVHLEGTSSNKGGLGAKVTVTAGHLEITRQAGSSMSWGGQSQSYLQFGLFKAREGGYRGDPTPVDVKIEWPSGTVDVYVDIFERPPRSVRFIEGVGYENDTAAPRPSMLLVDGTEGDAGWYTSSSVELFLTAADQPAAASGVTGTSGFSYSKDKTTWTDVNPLFGASVTFTGDGSHDLWIKTSDVQGNEATIRYPVRLDSTAPTGAVADPLPGGVYAQGLLVGQVPGLERAVLLAPVATDLGALGPAEGPASEMVGSEGFHTVRASAIDTTSGIAGVTYAVTRTDGFVPPGMAGETPFAPYAWDWPAYQNGPGEFRVKLTITDKAGNVFETLRKVEVVPTTTEGMTSPPSNPTP